MARLVTLNFLRDEAAFLNTDHTARFGLAALCQNHSCSPPLSD